MRQIWREVPVRDGLECYFRALQDRAQEGFMHSQILYVNGGMKKAPKVPAILQMQTRKRRPLGRLKEPEKPAFLSRLEEVEG